MLNKVVKSFEDSITQILATNLNEQIREQMDLALKNLNGYFAVNPDLVLGLLDITMDDLEEKVVRDLIIAGTRPDGRDNTSLRQIHCAGAHPSCGNHRHLVALAKFLPESRRRIHNSRKRHHHL